MDYPGNASLTREMQQRILSTFQQTLSAAAAGNRQEATLGCDFILRLDSLFAPARQLLDRLEEGEGPVSVDDLAAAAGVAGGGAAEAAGAEAQVPEPPVEAPAATPPQPAAAPTAAAPPPEIDDLSDLDLEMGLSDPAPAPSEPAAAPQPPAAPAMPAAAPSPPDMPAAPPPVPDEPVAAPPPPETPAAAPPDESAAAPPPPEEPAVPQPPPEEAIAAPAPPEEPAPAPPPPEEPAVAPAPDVPVAAPPPPEAPAAEVEPPPPAAAARESAPAPPKAPEAPAVDQLDDLDLSLPSEAAPPPEPSPPEPEAPTEDQEASAMPAPEPQEVPETEAADEETPPTPPEEQPAAPPLPESVEIPLGAEPSAQLDTESQQRIDDLLAEGQEAFDGGEYQLAIDAWSRIFLIDIDHADANKRIEEARKLKAEADRKVEERFHEGLAHLESGESDAATASFRAVLEMQSSHLAARNYLEKLEAGEVPVPTELSRPADDEVDHGAPETIEADAGDEPDEQPEPKPDRGSKAVGESMVSVKKSPLKSKSFLAIAAVGMIAVLGGAWYLFDNWSSLFPNSAQEAPAPAVADPLARAKGLHDAGKTPIAIAQLRRLPPSSPQYEEAQALIAQWELEQAPTGLAPEGPSPQELARREALVAEAGAAADRREFMRTSELLSEAATIAPLRGPEVQLLARADEELQELQNFITIFREGEWDLALRDLWLLRESDPGNRDVTRLLVDSYYNLGLRALQRKDAKAAAEHFTQALELSPNDPELPRLADFAVTYQTRSTDLLYRIFVKYHPFR